MANAGSGEVILSTEHAGRKLWLVKVPHFVAKKWRGVCDKAMNEEHDETGPKLGTIRITPPSADAASPAHPRFDLLLDNPETAALPQEYAMSVATHQTPATLAFSDNAGRMAVEGVVQHKFDVEPVHRDAGGASGGLGKMQIDPAYRKLARERDQAANVKTRTVQVMSDRMITNIRRPVGALMLGQKRKGDSSTKRVALAAPDLQAMLFRLFERQPHWSFAQLQQQTEQPTQHLKAVLLEIALQNKRGPYRDLWELRKEFKTGGKAAAAAPEGDGDAAA